MFIYLYGSSCAVIKECIVIYVYTDALTKFLNYMSYFSIFNVEILYEVYVQLP